MGAKGPITSSRQRSRLGGPLLFSLLLHGLLLWGLGSWLVSGPGAVEVMVVELAAQPQATTVAAANPPAAAPSPAAPAGPPSAAQRVQREPRRSATSDERIREETPRKRVASEPPAADIAPASAANSTAPVDLGAVRRRYLSEVAALIEAHKRYPLMARKLRQQGSVQVHFRLERTGTLLEARITASSGHSALDRAARQAVEDVASFPPVPELLGATPDFVVAIVFTLQ